MANMTIFDFEKFLNAEPTLSKKVDDSAKGSSIKENIKEVPAKVSVAPTRKVEDFVYTVYGCSEFHSLGDCCYFEQLADAITYYKTLPENYIPGIGIAMMDCNGEENLQEDIYVGGSINIPTYNTELFEIDEAIYMMAEIILAFPKALDVKLSELPQDLKRQVVKLDQARTDKLFAPYRNNETISVLVSVPSGDLMFKGALGRATKKQIEIALSIVDNGFCSITKVKALKAKLKKLS